MLTQLWIPPNGYLPILLSQGSELFIVVCRHIPQGISCQRSPVVGGVRRQPRNSYSFVVDVGYSLTQR